MIKLLLVEDDASLRYIVQGGLEDMIGGYEVITAANGEEGLKQWKEQHPDVIVSDIEMPVMNGYEMVKRIRETDGETPILFSSALISPKDVVKGYEIGANNYIKKPFIPEELDAHVHALLKLSKGEKSKDTSQCYKIGKEYVLDATPLRQGCKLIDLINRPQVTLENMAEHVSAFRRELDKVTERKEEIIEAAEILIKYEGYIGRERMYI